MKKLLSLFVALIATITLWAGNTITYTATSKLLETTSPKSSGLHTNAFNVSIISHTFTNGTGTIIFFGDVTSIGNYAFRGCSALTDISIPNSVTNIGEEAFYHCSSLTSIAIPSSVTNINDWAFGWCSNLSSITIPTAVLNIGEDAFSFCSNLASITVESENTAYDSRNDCNAIIETVSNALIVGCQNTIIPSSVTSLRKSAFEYCSNLTSITIPSSVTSIGENAFNSCSGLTSILIPNSVEVISEGAFAGCSGLTSITIGNSVTSIGNDAFYGCTNLTSITIPKSVTSIGDRAFLSCSGLTAIVVESENTIYDSRNNCNSIIETASNKLIVGCQNTNIPNSVTNIGDYAFNDCYGLTSIIIPNSVTRIGYYAFGYCYGLTSIICEAINPPTCGNSCFNGVDKSIPLYVPAGSVTAYQSAEVWRDFTNIQAITPARIEIPITADQWHYIAFPVEVTSDMIEYDGNGTWGYYDGARRASGVSGWQNASFPLNANQGYIFYGDQTGTLYVNIDPATLPSGNQSITLTNYSSFHSDNENWNFVGNPYYETYNVSHIAPNGMNLYVWNGTGYYAKTAGHDSYDLQPLEAFFVQKKNTENSVNFAAASAGAAAPARAWAANSNRYIDIAAVAGCYTDYTRVVLNETASMDYTTGYDIAKFFSDEAPIQLFTLDVQSIECGVQELPNGVEEIALGYTVLESGEVVVSATDMEETYYLYDAETGITTDLRQSNYTFTAEAGTTVNRLSLRRAPGTATGVDGVNKYVNTITKVVREGQVLILRGEKMYDLRGQEVK